MRVIPVSGFQTYKKQNFGIMPSRDMIIDAASEAFKNNSPDALNVLLVDMHLQERGRNHIEALLEVLEYYTSLPRIKDLWGIERRSVAGSSNHYMGSRPAPITPPPPPALF